MRLQDSLEQYSDPSNMIFVKSNNNDLYKLYDNNLDFNKVFIDSKNSTNDKIIFSTSCKSEQFLFISEIYYPGWTCKKINLETEEEEEIEIYKVNGAFRGISVPQGEYKYIMEFKSSEQKYGKVISYIGYLIASLLVLIGIIFNIKSKKKVDNEEL